MSFSLVSGKKQLIWSQPILVDKLKQLGNAKKHVVWIRRDLSTEKSNWFTRMIWTGVAKHFDWMRKTFYHVDLEHSKKILNSLRPQVEKTKNQQLIILFNKAVVRFNTIAPKHTAKYCGVPDASLFSDSEENRPQEPSKGKRTEDDEFRDALESGADPNALLKKAFNEERPAIAAWMLQKGAKLESIKGEVDLANSSQKELFEWLINLERQVDPTPETLDFFALDLGLGYKTANLLVMRQKTEQINKTLVSATVKVPPFLPVGDYEMTVYMRQKIPELFTLWTQVLDTFDPNARSAFMDAKNDQEAGKMGLKITNEGKAILNQIRLIVKDHFQKHPLHSPQISEWLKKEKPSYVIVRSTGKEDTETNSNAGGNASIPFVKPTTDAISEAAGEVVASYFSEKSINQRLLQGERALFTDQKPFFPLLIQEMIMENVGGKGATNEEIPRSGVLFTRQSDKAENVTFIQTGLGNNEGVVTSQVGVDSYFVKEGIIHAVVREKEARFVCVKKQEAKFAVQPIKNENRALRESQALSNSLILDLKRVADAISESYAKEKGQSKPMDMEYTVKLKEKGTTKPVIYLLQARPLLAIQGEDAVQHTYLDLKGIKGIKEGKKIKGDVLLDGNAYVREITDASSIIFADTLPKGGYAYSHADDPSRIKVIVVNKTATATSHEAVILRQKGVAVLVVENLKHFEMLKALSSQASSEPVLVDTQRGIAVAAPNGASNLIKKGLVTYPIPLEVTVPPSFIMGLFPQNLGKKQIDEIHERETLAAEKKIKLSEEERLQILHLDLFKNQLLKFNKETKNLIDTLLDGQKPLTIAHGTENGYEIEELLDLMATGDAPVAKLALGTLLNLMLKRLVKSMHETEDFRANVNQSMFQVFEAAIKLAKKEIVPALETYAKESLERLYPIKFLDAMIHQESKDNIMSCHSYYQVLEEDFKQQNAVKVAKDQGIDVNNLNGWLLALQQMKNDAYNEECADCWQHFVKELAELKKEDAALSYKNLFPIIEQMQHLGVLDTWLNTSFMKARKQFDPKKGIASTLINELQAVDKQNEETFSWISSKLPSVQIYELQIPLWQNRSHAKAHTANLQKEFTENLGFDKLAKQGSLKAIYEQSKPLGRLALLQYIRKAVTVYDCIIKEVKGSQNFASDKEMANQIGELLFGYLDMMEAVFTLLSRQDEKEMMKISFLSSKEYTFGKYIDALRNGVEYHYGFKNKHNSPGLKMVVDKVKSGDLDASFQLEARENFAVDALIIGSHADLDFSVHWPERLEEYFTTFHQNMDQVVKFLNTKNGLDTTLLSKLPKEICNEIYSTFQELDISYLVQEKSTIKVGYQIPLRQHSASLVVKYNPSRREEGITLEIQMFGNDERYRWDWEATFGSVMAYTFGRGFAKATPPKINYNECTGVSFSMHLADDFQNIAKLVEAIHFMTKILMTVQSNAGDPTLLLKFIENGYHNFTGLGTAIWQDINPDCFKYTLHINENLIYRLMEKDAQVAGKIAVNSFIGMAYYGLKDYERNYPFKSSLVEAATKALTTIIPINPQIADLTRNLLNKPDMQSAFPDVCKNLSACLKSSIG